MKLDLAAAAQAIANASKGRVRVEFTGGKIEIDEAAFVGRLADAVATAMGQNLYRGMRPDGSGLMPGRKLDDRPRGKKALVARAIASVQRGDKLEWLLGAHRERPGHLERILQEVPLRPPPLETLRVPIAIAFRRSVKSVGAALGKNGPSFGSTLRWGGGGKAFRRPKGLGKFIGRSKDNPFNELAASGRFSRKVGRSLGRRPKTMRDVLGSRRKGLGGRGR